MLRVEKEYGAKRLMTEDETGLLLLWTFWLFWLTSTAMETHDLSVMLFKNSYFSKVKADLYETT